MFVYDKSQLVEDAISRVASSLSEHSILLYDNVVKRWHTRNICFLKANGRFDITYIDADDPLYFGYCIVDKDVLKAFYEWSLNTVIFYIFTKRRPCQNDLRKYIKHKTNKYIPDVRELLSRNCRVNSPESEPYEGNDADGELPCFTNQCPAPAACMPVWNAERQVLQLTSFATS